MTLSDTARLDKILIWPVFIGQRPLRSLLVQGFSCWVMAVYPYAMTFNSAVTFPEMAETPTMLKERVLLSGVNTTSNRVAEKLELDWQGLSDFDSMSLMADVKETRFRRAKRRVNGDNSERRIVKFVEKSSQERDVS